MRKTTHHREKATNTAHTPTHEAAEEETTEEGEAEATTLKGIDGTTHQKKKKNHKKSLFFKTPPQRRGSHFFPRRVDLLLQKLLLKTPKMGKQTKPCKSEHERTKHSNRN